MKNNAKMLENVWKDYIFDTNKCYIDNYYITLALDKFWEDVIVKIQKGQMFVVQFKVKNSDGMFRSISYIQISNKDEFDKLIEIFKTFWLIRSDDYHQWKIDHIVFCYKILSIAHSTQIKSIKSNYHINDTAAKEFSSMNKFYGFNLPNTMDFSTWGKFTYINKEWTKAHIKMLNSNIVYHLCIKENYYICELLVLGKSILSFKDIMKDVNELSTFTRMIKNQEYEFINGVIVLKQIKKETKFLKSIKPSLYRSDKFITMDLETRTIKGEMIPFCVSLFDGVNLASFYLSDYNNSNEMLISSVKYLMKSKYHNYKVYIHNFSHFDAIFLIRILSSLTDVIRPIIRENRIIDLKFKFKAQMQISGHTYYSIYFRDSYLLLPLSLQKLAINFEVENKGMFPFKFVNDENISLDYDGIIPLIDYFDDLTNTNEDEKQLYIKKYTDYYLSFNNNSWNLRSECVKYCEQDVKTLYQIIDKFSKEIYKLFRLDILKYPTLSSLAFGIYRSSFLGDYKIPLIDGNIFKDIKKGYTGGSVDVYKPYGENIWHYDVNSLYPFVMKQFEMPVGTPIYFEGDITIVHSATKPFGIFEVEVETPSDLKIPLLQSRFKMKDGYRTIAPLGKWKGTFFSEELYAAVEYGYKFKILRGYLFDKSFIFGEYVDFLYNIKSNSKKDSAHYIISKLLLNSLYGRLGMNPISENHLIISLDQVVDYYKKYKVTNVIDLKNGKELISFFDETIESECSKSLNISIPISTAVTGYARMVMTKYKHLDNTIIYYTDTDSIFINRELDPLLVGDKIGQMKLEHVFKKAIFLSPKAYGGIYFKNGKEQEFIKIKGLKTSIKFNELLGLLNKDSSIILNQEKWHRNISQANILVKEDSYKLIITENKRQLIYDSNGKFIDTLPLITINGEFKT